MFVVALSSFDRIRRKKISSKHLYAYVDGVNETVWKGDVHETLPPATEHASDVEAEQKLQRNDRVPRLQSKNDAFELLLVLLREG